MLSLAVALTAAIAAPVQAQTMRVPLQGEPALMVDVPAGWKLTQTDPDNGYLLSPDRTTVLQLSMIAGPEVASVTLSQIAASIFRSAGAEPYSSSAPATAVGHKGEAFVSHTTNDKGVRAKAVATLARLDANHVAGILTLTMDGATAGQAARLNALVKRVRLSGAP